MGLGNTSLLPFLCFFPFRFFVPASIRTLLVLASFMSSLVAIPLVSNLTLILLVTDLDHFLKFYAALENLLTNISWSCKHKKAFKTWNAERMLEKDLEKTTENFRRMLCIMLGKCFTTSLVPLQMRGYTTPED